MAAGRRAGVAALALGVIVAIYAVSPRQQEEVKNENHDAALRGQLGAMRSAIARFKRENGRYPANLQELVPKYLPSIPVDPVTSSSDTWRVTMEVRVHPNYDFMKTPQPASESYLVNVHSGAGRPYSEF